MGQEYVPFPPFEGWLPSYNGSLVDEVGEQIANARERYGQEAADRAVEVASRYAAVDTGALEGLYTTNRGFTRTIAERTANWEAALAAHPEAAHHIRDALGANPSWTSGPGIVERQQPPWPAWPASTSTCSR